MERALVLNASYEPLTVVSSRRAAVLVLCEKAEAVEVGSDLFRSPTFTIECPTVVRLCRYVKVPYRRKVGTPSLAGLKARDGTLCAYCTKRPADSIDHVIPRSQGGPHTWTNTVGACTRCNFKKANRTPAEANMELRVEPALPHANAWLAGPAQNTPTAWQPYLFSTA